MAAIKKLKKDRVLKTAMHIVRGAKKNIKATMSIEEELKNPLPDAYFSLLKKKMGGGITVTRVGFGSKKDFDKIKNNVLIKDSHYNFHCVHQSGYRRMLLIDDSKLMFAKNSRGKKQFFYTNNPKEVEKYGTYFMQCRRKK